MTSTFIVSYSMSIQGIQKLIAQVMPLNIE